MYLMTAGHSGAERRERADGLSTVQTKEDHVKKSDLTNGELANWDTTPLYGYISVVFS